jgi:hypothetical protein
VALAVRAVLLVVRVVVWWLWVFAMVSEGLGWIADVITFLLGLA